MRKIQNLRNLCKLFAGIFLLTLLIGNMACRKQKQCVNCIIKKEDFNGAIKFYNSGGTIDFPETKIWEAKGTEVSEVVDIRLANAGYIILNERINDLTKEFINQM